MARKKKTTDKKAEKEAMKEQSDPNTQESGIDTNQNGKENQTDEKVITLQTELAELKDKYLRLFAEFDNYKKRTAKEKLDLIRTASEDLMQQLLPVLDDFDRAKKSADDENSDETFTEGVSLVYSKLYATLQHKGLKPMDTSETKFDPELHEAITKIPAPNKKLKGKILDFIEKGYYLNDKIIRYGKVVIGE
jgi:molecular chaperone GrpE